MSRRRPNVLDVINPNPIMQVFLIFGYGFIEIASWFLDRTGFADRWNNRRFPDI